MLRRLSVTSMVMSFKAGRFVSAGARRVVKVVMAAEAAVAARTASIAVNLATCPATVRSQKNQESLVVAAEEVPVPAETASTVVSLVICLVNVISLGNPESLRDLAADQAAEIEALNFISRGA